MHDVKIIHSCGHETTGMQISNEYFPGSVMNSTEPCFECSKKLNTDLYQESQRGWEKVG